MREVRKDEENGVQSTLIGIWPFVCVWWLYEI